MKIPSFFIAILVCTAAAAQSPYGPTNDSLYLGFRRDSIALLPKPMLVIVPFHPNRYLSDIDGGIAQGTNYTYQHTRGFFRKGLDNAILIAANAHNQTQSMHADRSDVNLDLDFIYKVTAVRNVPYAPPVVKATKQLSQRLADYWNRLQTTQVATPEPGTRIENGQLMSVADTRALQAKTVVINPLLFDSLQAKYKPNYYLFVNELHMSRAAGSQQALESDDFSRRIAAHITVFDADGHELFSLVKDRFFPSYKNDLPTIISEDYLALGAEIVYAFDSYRFLQAGLKPITEAETIKATKPANNFLSKLK